MNLQKNAIVAALVGFWLFSGIVKASPILHPAIKDTIASAEAEVPAGTTAYLESKNDITSKHLATGMNICLYLKYPIKMGNHLLIPAGTPAICQVTVTKPQAHGFPGAILIEPLYLESSNQEIIPLSGKVMIQGISRGSTEDDVIKGLMFGESNIFLQPPPGLIGSIVPIVGLFIKGKHAVIPRNFILVTSVEHNTLVKIRP